MDKFVVRTPTWKTLTYTASVNKGKLPETKQSSLKKKPLQENVEQTIVPNSTKTRELSRRLSIRDEKLLQLFASKPDQPLLAVHDDDSFSSTSQNSSTSISLPVSNTDENLLWCAAKNTTTNKNHLCDLSDYVNCVPTTQSQQTLLISQSSSVTFNKVLHEDLHNPDPTSAGTDTKGSTVFRTMNDNEQQNGESQTPKQNPQMTRIQRDLNSPSASLRMRALKALKSSTKTAYSNFDIPHEEQSIITEEERKTPPPALTIQELMKDIVVYVEVRTGEDNRSAGVKKVISLLGARVNDKLLRDTTHVVFKDGLLSTYKKAKHWNIPVVSILWIEACKTQGRICDPQDYPISNIDRYENPELYHKMKRHKSMQPDSECNRRVRAKPATPKDSTSKTAAETLRKASFLIGDNPTPISKQTDISTYFTSSGKDTNTPKGDGEAFSIVTPLAAGGIANDSPATQLLNRINSNCYTPLVQAVTSKTILPEKVNESSTDSDVTIIGSDVRRTLDFSVPQEKTNAECAMSSPKKRILLRRRSVQTPAKAPNTSSSSLRSIDGNNAVTPRKPKRRRSSMHATTSASVNSTPLDATQKQQSNEFRTILEEENMSISAQKPENNITETPKPRVLKRRSTYTNKSVEVSPEGEVHQKKRRIRRRTLYTPQSMEVSTDAFLPSFVRSAEKRKRDENSMHATPTNGNATSTALIINGFSTPQQSGSLLEEHSNTLFFSSARPAHKRRTIFDVSMDIITQRLQNINKSARRSVAPSNESDLNTMFGTEDDDIKLNKAKATIDLTKTSTVNGSGIKKSDNGYVKPVVQATVPSPSKIIKKRKLYVPDDTVLVLTSTPPRAIGNVKRRRTVVPTSSNTLATSPKSTSSVGKKPSGKKSNTKRATAQKTAAAAKEVETATKSEASMKSKSEPELVQLVRKSKSSEPGAAPDNTVVAANVETTNAEADAEQQESAPEDEPPPLTKAKTALNITQRNDAEDNVALALKQVEEESIINVGACIEITSANGQSESAINEDVQDVAQAEASKAAAMTRIKRKLPYLVCTNMHKEQVHVIREAIDKLGGFHLDHFVNDDTTHVISYEPRRTLNLLRALIRGLWILEYSWVLESLRAGRWVTEEPYELKNFSRAVEICRAERQAFGNIYKCELFTDLGPFYVSSRCGPISKENLRELIELCGGRIVEQRKRAKYILGDSNRSLEDKIYITPFWILDSITQMQVLKFQRYAYPTELTKASASQQLLQQVSQQSQLQMSQSSSQQSHHQTHHPATSVAVSPVQYYHY